MANIKDLLGDAYKEGMSAEDQLKALEGIQLPMDRTDEIERLKKAKDNASSEAADYKRKLKERMSEEEKRVAEEAEKYQKMEAENAELRKKIAIADFTAKFATSGLDADTASKCAEAAYTGDIETVIASYNAKMEAVRADVKAQMIADAPKLKGGQATASQVKDYQSDISAALDTGDFAKAAALTRVAQESNTNI